MLVDNISSFVHVSTTRVLLEHNLNSVEGLSNGSNATSIGGGQSMQNRKYACKSKQLQDFGVTRVDNRKTYISRVFDCIYILQKNGKDNANPLVNIFPLAICYKSHISISKIIPQTSSMPISIGFIGTILLQEGCGFLKELKNRIIVSQDLPRDNSWAFFICTKEKKLSMMVVVLRRLIFYPSIPTLSHHLEGVSKLFQL